jgi:ArsR family transcriptional regulator
MSPHSNILDHAATLAEITRCRILELLERHELTVSELCGVLQMPQSTVSRHLKVLAEGGWVRARRDGTSHLYQAASAELEEPAARLWELIRGQLEDSPAVRQDLWRLESVLRERRERSREFFSTAGEWDRLRDELFGRRFDLQALLGLLDRGWTVGDLGCGTGRIAAALGPFVARVVAVDGSAAMLEAARQRLEGLDNVEIRCGELERLPIEDGRLDAATLVLALPYQSEPERVLAEARRVLKGGGRLLVVDMLPHEREEYRQQMGHVWLGFSAERVEGWLKAAGFCAVRCQPLAAETGATGPSLFAATAAAPAAAGRSVAREGEAALAVAGKS